MQFKLETVDDGISLFVRENVDAEWVRADKRLIQMIDETTPREDTPTPTPAPTPQPTPAAIPVPTPAPTPVIAPRKVQTLPQTGDGFPLLAIVVVSLASATGIVLLTVKQRNALKETSDRLAKAALNQLRTQRLAEGGYTDAVDDALTRLLHAHTPLFIW